MKKVRVMWAAVAVAVLIVASVGAASASTIRATEARNTPAEQVTASAKAWLGVSVQPLNPRLAERLGVGDTNGVAIVRIFPNSPAAKAGLRRGDVITAYNLVAIATAGDLIKQVGSSKPSDKVALTIRRGKEEVKVEVTLEEKKAPAPKAFGSGKRLPPELSGVAPQDLFQHFLGVKADFTDKDGKPVAIQVTPGIVSSADAGSITLKPNGKESTVTYKIDSATVILLQGRRVETSELKKDDRVLVYSVNENARSIRIVGDAQHMFPLGGLLPGVGIGSPGHPAIKRGHTQRPPFRGPITGRVHKGPEDMLPVGRLSPDAGRSGPRPPEMRRDPSQRLPFGEALPGPGHEGFDDGDGL